MNTQLNFVVNFSRMVSCGPSPSGAGVGPRTRIREPRTRWSLKTRLVSTEVSRRMWLIRLKRSWESDPARQVRFGIKKRFMGVTEGKRGVVVSGLSVGGEDLGEWC